MKVQFVFSLLGNSEPYLTIISDESKVTSMVWGPLDEYIITGHENGSISKYDAQVMCNFLAYVSCNNFSSLTRLNLSASCGGRCLN